MQEDVHICPNVVTYICILKACTIVGSLQIGEYIAAEVRKRGLLHKDVVLGTALVDMYAKCGALEKAQEVFECLPMRNVVTWSALITGYTQHGLGDEALKCYMQMQDAGVCPNLVTYMCVLSIYVRICITCIVLCTHTYKCMSNIWIHKQICRR